MPRANKEYECFECSNVKVLLQKGKNTKEK
jgi:hypothetical protein